MRIRELEHGLNLAQPSEGYVRSEGLHMSDLYGSLYQALEPKRFRAGGKFDTTKMEVGTSFEEVLEPVLASRLLGSRPGEFVTQDGHDIIFSPDYLFDIDGELVLGEFKLTWYSSKGAPDNAKFDKWHTQIKCYLKHLQLKRARLYALFVNGNYKPPSPQLLAWDITYTQREIDDEWNAVLRHAKKAGLVK